MQALGTTGPGNETWQIRLSPPRRILANRRHDWQAMLKPLRRLDVLLRRGRAGADSSLDRRKAEAAFTRAATPPSVAPRLLAGPEASRTQAPASTRAKLQPQALEGHKVESRKTSTLRCE